MLLRQFSRTDTINESRCADNVYRGRSRAVPIDVGQLSRRAIVHGKCDNDRQRQFVARQIIRGLSGACRITPDADDVVDELEGQPSCRPNSSIAVMVAASAPAHIAPRAHAQPIKAPVLPIAMCT